ncbi:carbohydrate kinase [Salinimonas sp. HHU 13199]|uniref:Carbohydrate kinase n=1 Tax=Salinimonas profundi TaxID=2729140 RepID=A0ABR8LJ89_9ALTE|nr:carbohydrate kinase [Salinimonas profundi]MBD3586278.1 carbohydrate kinase [Salinimonas profundi]
MQILCLGEVLVDMLGQDVEQNGESSRMFRPYAGGAPANVAVAVAKLGGSSALISKVGNDSFGKMLVTTLKSYEVDDRFIATSEGKTALAFVDLDEQGERTFDFYVENAAHKDITNDDVENVALDQQTLLHLCSGSFSTAGLRTSTTTLIQRAHSCDAPLCMDINFRPGFWQDPTQAPAIIDNAARQMNIIKASHEELEALYGEHASDKVQQWHEAGVALILITDGGQPVSYISTASSGSFAVPATSVKDTTAAGDAFIGGLLYQLAASVSGGAQLETFLSDNDNIVMLLDVATRCGAVAVSRFGAFDALPSRADIISTD